MSSDGPKNSQGFIQNLAAAGMTGDPWSVQILRYTDGECTPEVARVRIREMLDELKRRAPTILQESSPAHREKTERDREHKFMEPIRDDPNCPPALRKAINKHFAWRNQSLMREEEKVEKARREKLRNEKASHERLEAVRRTEEERVASRPALRPGEIRKHFNHQDAAKRPK